MKGTCKETHLMVAFPYGEFFYKPQKQPPEVFYKKGVLENFAISTENQWSFFLACSFIKTRPHNSCFPVNFEKLLRTSFSQNVPGDCF